MFSPRQLLLVVVLTSVVHMVILWNLINYCAMNNKSCTSTTTGQRFYKNYVVPLMGERGLRIETTYQQQLKNAGDQFIEYAEKTGNTSKPSIEEVKLTISFVSVKRQREYLKIVVGALLQQLTNKHRQTTVVRICNGDTKPSDRQEAQKLCSQLDIHCEFIWETRNVLEEVKGEKNRQKLLHKETLDYAHCLETGANSNPGAQFHLLLEDDAMIKSDFMDILEEIMPSLASNNNADWRRKGELKKETTAIKLYHPAYLRKTPWAPQSIAILLMFFFTMDTIVSCTGMFKLNVSILRMVMFLCTPISLLAIFTLASTLSVHPPSYLTIAESCCTPAVLFPAVNVEKVTATLLSASIRVGHAKDHVLDEMLGVWMTGEDMVTHIGHVSYVHNQKVPKIV